MAFLGGLFGPSPPDPNQLAAQQAAYNTAAAQQQQQMNMFGQQTPYGSLSYVKDPNSPSGYTATQTLSPAEQQLLQLQQGLQGTIGGTAEGLGSQLAGLYGQPANIDPSAMTKQLMDWQTQYMQPYWDTQKSNLEAQLQNQGLTPGSEAFTNAMRGFTEGVGGARNQFFAQAEPTAFAQAIQQRELPLQEFGQIAGMFQGPQGPSFVNTPTAQVQPPNYTGTALSTYQQKLAQNQAMWGDIAKLVGAATGMAGGGGFAGGWGGNTGMFGGAGPVFGGTNPSAWYTG